MKCNGRLHVFRELVPRGPCPARLQPPGFALGSATSIDRFLQPSIKSGHLHALLSESIRCCNSTCTCPPSLASTQAALVFLSTYFSITSARSFSPEDRIRCPRPCLLVPMAFSVRSPLAGKVKGQVLAMPCEKRKIGWGTKTEGRRRGREECRESHWS